MERQRKAFGHDKPSFPGKKNTIMYHQIIAFNPDECDINSGVLTPEKCLAYSKQYAQKHYANHQVVFALHKENCKEDKTERYAMHMAINRTDPVSGNRYDIGRSWHIKKEMARRAIKMDNEWSLMQVVEGQPNSKVHARQPGKAEKEILVRAEKQGLENICYKANVRSLIEIARDHAISKDAFITQL